MGSPLRVWYKEACWAFQDPTVAWAMDFGGMQPARMPQVFTCNVQGGLLGMVPFDPMGQISDKNRQSEVRNGRCACASVHQTASGVTALEAGPSMPVTTL